MYNLFFIFSFSFESNFVFDFTLNCIFITLSFSHDIFQYICSPILAIQFTLFIDPLLVNNKNSTIQLQFVITYSHQTQCKKYFYIFGMNKETTLKLRPHSYYYQKFYKQLAQPYSVIEPLAILCGGWYFQTFKQVTNKLSKNKSSPLPMYFPNVDSMDSISKNRQLLKSIFKGFDTRGLGKIDACELYSSLLILSKGSYEVYLKTIVDIFGFQIPGKITRYEFFFFLDSFYRAIPKILIVKGFEKPTQQNIRLEFKDINRFIEKIFQEKQDMERGQIYEALMKQPQLNDFLKYLQKKCMNSAQHYRNATIDKIKLQSEVRSTLTYILNEVQKRFKGDNLMLNEQL